MNNHIPPRLGQITESDLQKAEIGTFVSLAIAGGIATVALVAAWCLSGEALGLEPGTDITDV
jgi:hypothetical protein